MTPLGEVLFAAFWVLPVVAFVYGLLFDEDRGDLSQAAWWWWLIVAVLLALGAAWSWLVYDDLFRNCYEVQLGDDGACEFRSPLRRTRLHVRQITSLYPKGWFNDEFHTGVRYEGGERFIIQPLEDFSDFLARLRSLNPNVQMDPSVESHPNLEL